MSDERRRRWWATHGPFDIATGRYQPFTDAVNEAMKLCGIPGDPLRDPPPLPVDGHAYRRRRKGRRAR